MPATASKDIAPDTAELTPGEILAALRGARRRTHELVAHLSAEDLERVHSPIMSPLVWDLAHIAAYEDLWLAHRHAGLELLRPDLAEVYDAFETPRQQRGEIELLDFAQARAYMDEVSERTAAAIARHGVGDGFVHEMVVRHELQHTETMRQTMALADLLPPGEPPRAAVDAVVEGSGANGTLLPHAAEGAGARDADPDWIEIPAGAFTMGAGPHGFAYDNERPRHTTHTGAFLIAHRPVSKASWMRFSEGGGYERREWWSDEGWAWKEQYDITHHTDAATGDPQAPVCHVSWFEADAFARANKARLPTEAEWERAATWEQRTHGSGGAAPAGHSGVLEGANAAGPAGHRGVLEDVGQVWEWTASHFSGYPGFQAYPYREYSEVFFGPDYRVLRGGSWATSPRVATATFRNWDLPQRRQIFAGLRLAREV
jgi:gamma-glutamyl hercynylcysteine S-oxide synthase